MVASARSRRSIISLRWMKPEIEGRDRREELKTEIRGRRAIGDDGSRSLLIVVRCQPSGAFVHEPGKELPVPLAVAQHRGALRRE